MRNGLNLIKEFEGFSEKAYLCPADKWTIGYGSTFYSNNTPVKEGDVISKDLAQELLITVYDRFEAAIKKLLTVEVNENELGALVSFTYNVGLANFKESTLLKKLNAGDRVGAAEQFDRWIYAKKKVLKGLVARREKEKALFLQPAELVTPVDVKGIVNKLITRYLGGSK